MSALNDYNESYHKKIINIIDKIRCDRPVLVFFYAWIIFLCLIFIVILPGLLFLFGWKITNWIGIPNGWIFVIFVLLVALAAIFFAVYAERICNYLRCLKNN